MPTSLPSPLLRRARGLLAANRDRAALSVVGAALVFLTGCGGVPLDQIDGERYACECGFTVRTPVCVTSSRPLEGFCSWVPLTWGGETYEPTDREEQVPVQACTDFASTDPHAVCSHACQEYVRTRRGAIDPPSGLIETHGDPLRPLPLEGSIHAVPGFSRHPGDGRCTEDAAPGSTILTFPSVPNDSVRNGYIDPYRSTIDVTIEGVGRAEDVPAEDRIVGGVHTSRISIGLGSCSSGMTCPFSINEMTAFFPSTVTIGDLTIDNFAMRFAGGASTPARGEVTRRPTVATDAWALAPGSWLPLELVGTHAGNPVSATADWGLGATGEVRPHGELTLRRGADPKFIQVTGTATRVVDFGPAGVRNVTVDADLRYRFYGGAPEPVIEMSMSPLTSTEVVLDGTGTVDELGGVPDGRRPLDFEWLVFDTRTRAYGAIAHGRLAQIPRAAYDSVKSGNGQLCLRVYDEDRNFGTTCRALGPLPPPSNTVPVPGCGDVALAPVRSQTFLRIVEVAGMFDELQAKGNGKTVVVPSDTAFAAMPTPEREKLLVDKAAARAFVARHIAQGVYPASSIAKGFPKLKGKLTLPDRPCGDGLVHESNGTVAP